MDNNRPPCEVQPLRVERMDQGADDGEGVPASPAAPTATAVAPLPSSATVCSALHLPLTMPPQSVRLPQAPDELTLRAVQFLQACWDAGRPSRRERALAAGTFEGEFDRLDAARTPAATALPRIAAGEWVDVSARSGGEVCGLARHRYTYLFNEPLAIENLPSMPPQAQEKFSEKTLTSVSMHTRRFDRPYDAAVHVTRREVAFLQSPLSGKPPSERSTGDPSAQSPILPSSVVLNSPMKKRMAAIHDASSSCGDAVAGATPSTTPPSTPPPSTRINSPAAAASSQRRQDPFAFAASADPLRQWDAIKVPCELRRLTCSSVDNAKWALSAQGTPYAYVLVPMTTPPTWNWVRVNSGHVDPDSVAGMVTRKCHVGSFLTLCCGNATCVWGVSQDAVDFGRCVARVGFTEDAPNGTDWLNMSGGIMPDPPTASERAQHQFEQYAATTRRASSTNQIATTTTSSPAVAGRRRFQHVSVGMDGSVWAVVVAVAGASPSPSSSERRTSVWIREGAHGASLGTRWAPVALSQESFDYSRPYDPSRRKPYFEFMRLTHQVFHSVFALIAETPEQLADDAGCVYERCGASSHNLVGDCWRKILLDPSPPRSTCLVLPVQLSVIPGTTSEASETLVRTLSVASDGGAWLIDSNQDLRDATNCFARARANPSCSIIHDRYPGVENVRDCSIDGDLCHPDRSDLMPLIRRFYSGQQQRGKEQVSGGGDAVASTALVLTKEECQLIMSTSTLLDVSSLRSLIPDADAVLASTPPYETHALLLVDVDGLTFEKRGGPAEAYTLHLSWQLYPDAPALTFSIKTQPHAVFDPLLLQQVTAQVPETVRWTWSPTGPLPTLLSSASSGSLRNGAGYDVLHRLIGSDFLSQLDNTSPELAPALSSWLQLHYATTLPVAGMHTGPSWIESVVHRDLTADENAFEALQLLDPSLRRFQHVQTRRLTVRSKLMLCGAARTVTVVSQAPLGVPTPTVVVLCNDFDWAPHHKEPLLATFPCSTDEEERRSGGVPPRCGGGVGSFSSLAASLFAPWRSADKQRHDIPYRKDALEDLWSRAATTSPGRGEAMQSTAMKRYAVDVLDLVDTACRTFDWDMEYVALANASALVFPHEDRLAATASTVQRRPNQETCALEKQQNSDRSVLLEPGFSMICSSRSERAFVSLVERAAATHGVSRACVDVFTTLLKRLMCPESTTTSTAPSPLLLAANVSERLVVAAAKQEAVPSSSSASSAIDGLTRTIAFSSGALGGLDLLGALKDRLTHLPSMEPLHRRVELELLRPELHIVVEETGPQSSQSYSKTYRSGPAFSQGTFGGSALHGGSSTVKIVKVAIAGQLWFHVNERTKKNNNEMESDGTTEDQWASTHLPPSFSSNGEIVLFDVHSNTTDAPTSTSKRQRSDASSPSFDDPYATLSFVGDTTSLINWSSPGGIDAAHMVHPSVEVIMKLSPSHGAPTTAAATALGGGGRARLESLMELVEMRLVGEGILKGLLFEHGTMHFPVLEGGNPKAYYDVFGPSILRVQRRILPVGTLCRSMRMAAIASRRRAASSTPHQVDIEAASREVEVLEGALDRCCRLRHAECVAVPPRQQLCAASLPQTAGVAIGKDGGGVLVDLPRQGFCTTGGRSIDASCLLSGQFITISPSFLPPASQEEEEGCGCGPLFLGDAVGDGSFALCSRSANAALVWTLVKTTRNSLTSAGHHNRAAHLDPILRHGDCVTLHHVSSGTSIGEGDVEQNGGDGYKWIIGRQAAINNNDGQNDVSGCVGPAVTPSTSCWTPLRRNDVFTLTNVWSDKCLLFPMPSSSKPLQPTAEPTTEGTVAATCWRAAAAVLDAPMFTDATPCQFLGQPAVATVVAHNVPELVVGTPLEQQQRGAVVPVCSVSATLAHPLVFGHRTYHRGALIVLSDVDDASRGCSFSIELTEQQQQQLEEHVVQHTTTAVAEPPSILPSQVATSADREREDGSSNEASSPLDDSEGHDPSPDEAGRAEAPTATAASATTTKTFTTSIQYNLDFHLRNTALQFLGAHARCIGSSLNNGITGLALKDVVLHAVARYYMGPTHSLVPPLLPTHDNNKNGCEMHLCKEHATAVALQFAVEVPLERCSMLLPVPPSSLNVPSDPTTFEGASLFDEASSYSSAKVEGDVRCLGCLERIEETMRSIVRRKAAAAASTAAQQLDVVVDRLARLRDTLDTAQGNVEAQVEHHTSALLPDEAAAKTELHELTSQLTQLIRKQDALDAKIDQKPHKAAFYQQQRLQLVEQRYELMGAIDMAKDVHTYQRNVLSADVASLIKDNANIAAMHAEVRLLLSRKASCQKLMDVAAGTRPGGSSGTSSIDTLVAWALRSVSLHGWSDPTSETCSSQACIELRLDLIPRASGRMDLSNGATPLTSLSLLDPHASPLLTGGGRRNTTHPVAAAGSQTAESLTIVLPFDTHDVQSEDSAMPLKSFELFCDLVLEPMASRWIGDVLVDTLKARYGLSDEDINLLAAA